MYFKVLFKYTEEEINMNFLAYADVTCGSLTSSFSSKIPEMTHLVVTVIQIAVPVLLIIFGMFDLGKSVMAQKEDEIKKAQQTFVKRLVAAALVFFVVIIVQVVTKLVAGDEGENIWDCVNCFISGPAETAKHNGGSCTGH